MRVKPGILLIIGLLFLAGTVTAVGIPDTLTVTTDKAWIIANNVDQSTIIVKVTNTTSGPVQGVIVNLDVDPLYGNISPFQVTTNISGMALGTFKVSTKSGAAQINASIPAGVSGSTMQNIDHNSAYFADFSYPMNGTVASEVPFNVSLTDQYRNPVDDRRGNHIINLHVHGPFPDDCGFAEAGYAHDITRILDANGNATVNIKLTSKIGDNNIAMDGYESIPNQLEWISAEAVGKPFSMTQVISPSGSPPTLPADGVSYFTIIYNLFDEFGNPTNKQFIWVNTSIPGEEQQFLSNNVGQVTVQYGPRTSIGEIDIIATSVGNSTLTLTQRVKFKHTGAEIISLTANPDTMPSQDANPLFTSNIIATVADISGNAVPGETVDFIIENITYDASYNVSSDPNLTSSSAITDVYGRALVQFRPGSFTTVGNPGYNATATGHCTMNATWKNSTKKVPVTWKNYPYLSLSTSVNPHTVEINKTIDVTIEFRGDGFALQPTPIDVVMVIDKSGSMENYNIGGITRMQAAKNAASTFVNKMNEGTDRIGVVTFDREDTVITDAPLGAPFLTITNTINAIDPNNGGTAMRQGFKQGIDHIKANGRPSAVRAVILMTDGNWNLGGSPLAVGRGYDLNTWVRDNRDRGVATKYYGFSGLATDFEDQDYRWYSGLGGGNLSSSDNTVVRTPRKIDPATGFDVASRTTESRSGGSYYINGQFTQQNMSIYAKDNNIRLYTLSFAMNIPADERNALITLANSTGGFYRHAPTQASLEAFYTEIAGDLKDTAGVNATMTADFDKINVTGFEMDGDQVYDYVYHPTESTKIRWQDGITNVSDQSADWLADSKLDFNIGTIKVGQYWNATFRLKVKQGGLIDVFGNHSTVSFNGGAENLYLPQTFITVIPNLSVTNITMKTITLDNLMCTETGEIKALFPVQWSTNYTGNKTLTEKVYYRIDDKGPWVQFDIKTRPYDPLTMEYVNYAQLDVTKLPWGNYTIQVRATASDAPDATAETVSKTVGGRGKTFIKLEAPPFLDDTQFFNQNPWGIVDSRSI